MKRTSKLVTCAALIVLGSAHAATQLSAGLVSPIARQPLAAALREFATQTGLQLIYVSDIAATQVSKGAPRGVSAQDALGRLLEGTGLEFEFLNDRTVRIFTGRARAAVRSS